MLSPEQVKQLKSIIKDLAPEAEFSITKRKDGTGRIARDAIMQFVSLYQVTNRDGLHGTLELNEDAKVIKLSDGKIKGFFANYSPISTAIHELAHVLQVKNGQALRHSYAMMEVIAEYTAYKMMEKYFGNQYDENQKQASRYYMAQYYQNHSPVVKKWQRMTTGEIAKFKELATKLYEEVAYEIEPLVESLAKC